jgi:hypothetical protein
MFADARSAKSAVGEASPGEWEIVLRQLKYIYRKEKEAVT